MGLPYLTAAAHREIEKVVWEEGIRRAKAEQQKLMVDWYQSGEWQLQNLSVNGSWNTRHKSSMGTFTAVDVERSKIVHEETMLKECMQQINGKEVVITKGNYLGTLQGMECKGFCHQINWLQERGLLKNIECIAHDNNASIEKIMASNTWLAHIKVHTILSCHLKKNYEAKIKVAQGDTVALQGASKRFGRLQAYGDTNWE
ncbi:uncharacterized protein ACA1_339360 [Acanthamoeba castellanii str. Neff]|uniref:Uncharacterized protein n=1 Tax=Acanthamoeba castellanii (strain ATCC 30010 / Neff) TaxID=1257118 RepID=L8HD76_ACACF|nr:uncharacterized protein ACA1_339360 [Acanthamoeba castellanii str. Neff]ELR22713.1 hypothetical protein ACA1_339360 [Acanthamoeba castellanii str. Neff]